MVLTYRGRTFEKKIRRQYRFFNFKLEVLYTKYSYGYIAYIVDVPQLAVISRNVLFTKFKSNFVRRSNVNYRPYLISEPKVTSHRRTRPIFVRRVRPYLIYISISNSATTLNNHEHVRVKLVYNGRP